MRFSFILHLFFYSVSVSLSFNIFFRILWQVFQVSVQCIELTCDTPVQGWRVQLFLTKFTVNWYFIIKLQCGWFTLSGGLIVSVHFMSAWAKVFHCRFVVKCVHYVFQVYQTTATIEQSRKKTHTHTHPHWQIHCLLCSFFRCCFSYGFNGILWKIYAFSWLWHRYQQ